MPEIECLLDEGFLALVIDGCVKGVAFHMQISPQRVHQLVANDPFAGYMRMHRAMAATCPARAQQMADRFNFAHEELVNYPIAKARGLSLATEPRPSRDVDSPLSRITRLALKSASCV